MRSLAWKTIAARCVVRDVYYIERGRNGFDGIESKWRGVPGSELP